MLSEGLFRRLDRNLGVEQREGEGDGKQAENDQRHRANKIRCCLIIFGIFRWAHNSVYPILLDSHISTNFLI